MDIRYCSHHNDDPVVLLVAWCARCSGWRVHRLGAELGSSSDFASLVQYESHFLPQETTTPDELLHFIMRAFRCAQEWGDDRADTRQIAFEWGEGS